MATGVGLLAGGIYGSCYCQCRQASTRFYVVAGKSESSNLETHRMRKGRIEAVATSEPIAVAADPFAKEASPMIEAVESENVGINLLIPKLKVSIFKTETEDRELKVLEDDTMFRTESVKDYLDDSRDFLRPDGGPPRWFCPVECGRPMKHAPLLLFLPGTDGIGLGLIRHHRSLGRMFEVRCMHIPVFDRTPFEGLLKFVEEVLRTEHKLCPDRPIYLVGDSFGGCLALAVASRNPSIDLVLILSNPATCFKKSPLQPFFPLLETIPEQLQVAVPYMLSLTMGNPVKMALVDVRDELSPLESLYELRGNLVALLPRLAGLADIVPKETLLWKLKLIKAASSYANSRLHAVKADVLLLASGGDNLLPSRDEAERLWKTLENCTVRYFKDHGHTLLFEDGIDLATIIKSACMYRRSKRLDYVLDYLPPTLSEFRKVYDGYYGLLQQALSPVMLSTLSDGTIVRSLDGVPQEGPVLFVGYHMLMGLEMYPVVGEFLKQKNILVRGLAHPTLFAKSYESSLTEPSSLDHIRLFGAVPVTPTNFFRLLSTKSFVLLYPGGAREALHRKGEAYKLFWPERSEFVRMAARFGATIVPFAAVGEDDIGELVLDYNDLMAIPMTRDWIKGMNQDRVKLRSNVSGELGNQDLYLPGVLPKVPGRFYCLFGKPIETSKLAAELKDRDQAHSLYLRIKSQVENMFTYLIKKREEDPYRSIVQRSIFQASRGIDQQIPTFEL